MTTERVEYIYVDKDVTITGKGKTITNEGDSFTTKDFTLALKTGWNAIYTKAFYSASATPQQAMAVGNAALKWSYRPEDH